MVLGSWSGGPRGYSLGVLRFEGPRDRGLEV